LAWKIEYTDTARRQLRRIDKTAARRILDYMDERVSIVENPRTLGNGLRGPLGELWRYRVDEYRVICELQDAMLRVLVVRVGARKDVYR
jgi:mRNA interferase RelE/StbE